MPLGESHVSLVSKNFLGSKHDLQEKARPCPLTLSLSPNTKNVLGEREQTVGTLTQGGTSGSCPLVPPWATV